MEKLIDIQNVLFEEFEAREFYDRHIYHQFALANKINGIMGGRGVGKTTFLLHTAIQRGAKEGLALYVSADNIYFLEHKLFDLVDRLYKETDVRLLLIDEIHKYSNWNQELKNISDTYLNFNIVFTSSSMVDIVESKYDLSRRVSLYHLHGLSFREYLEYSQGLALPIMSWDEILSDHMRLSQSLSVPQILKHFNHYLKIGYYPYFKTIVQEYEVFQAIENAVQKTIYEDISTFYNIKTTTLIFIEKLYKYVVDSQPGELNAYKLSQHLEKSFDSITEYLQYLNKAGLIHFVFPAKSGKALMKNPTKMLPENPNLISASFLSQSEDAIRGKLRETFAVNQLRNAGLQVHYSEIGDYRVQNKTLIEIGGKNKTAKQIKGQNNAYVLSDGILTGVGFTIPLYLIGFMY